MASNADPHPQVLITQRGYKKGKRDTSDQAIKSAFDALLISLADCPPCGVLSISPITRPVNQLQTSCINMVTRRKKHAPRHSSIGYDQPRSMDLAIPTQNITSQYRTSLLKTPSYLPKQNISCHAIAYVYRLSDGCLT